MNIETKVLQVVAAQVGDHPKDITLAMDLDDFGMDSLDHIGTIMGLEDEFEIELDERLVCKETTVRDLVTMVKEGLK